MKGLKIALCTILMCALSQLSHAQETTGLTMYFPTGVSSTSVIKLDKTAPRDTRASTSKRPDLRPRDLTHRPRPASRNYQCSQFRRLDLQEKACEEKRKCNFYE